MLTMLKFSFPILLFLCQILVVAKAQSTVVSLFLGFLGEDKPMFDSVVGVVSNSASSTLLAKF